jgi:hypothetical protein
MTRLLLVLVGLALIGTIGFVVYRGSLTNQNPPRSLPLQTSPETSVSASGALPSTPVSPHPGNPVNLKGTIICLPPKNTKAPELMMCGLGLKTDDGSDYGLNFLNQQDLISNKTAGGNVVRVNGTLAPSSPGDQYVSQGTIDVTSITVLEKSQFPQPR